jgi:hypothetical protein
MQDWGVFDCKELCKILLNRTNVGRYFVTSFIFYCSPVCIDYDKNMCHAFLFVL